MTVKKLRVLLVDDEIHIRKLMNAVVTSMNCEIIGEATNGKEAVEMFRNEKPDILLLDINMPVKTGDIALQEIITEFPDAFVIMLTSVSDMGSVEKCLDIGAVNYVRKDTPISEIKEIIKETYQNFIEKQMLKKSEKNKE